MRADRLHGGTGIHAASRFGRKALSGGDDLAVPHGFSKYGRRDDARYLRRSPTVGHLLQLHHVHGGIVGGLDHPHPELPPPQRWHSRDVRMGKWDPRRKCFFHRCHCFRQIKVVFLIWLPWLLRMHRPHEPGSCEYGQQPSRPASVPTDRKPLHFQDVELKERSSKSLLANVLDIDDDFRHNHRGGGTPTPLPTATFFRTVYR